MATKKFIELQDKSLEDLQNELSELQAEQNKMKFDHAVNGLANPLEIRESRKNIARVKTEVRRREIEAMSAEQIAKRSKIRERRK